MDVGASVLNESVAHPIVPPNAKAEFPNCGSSGARMPPTGSSGYVYAIGRITPQFPDLGVEKEFVQLGGSTVARGAGMLETDRLIEILRDPATAYLARQLCWVFSAGDVDTFIIAPRDDAQTRAIVESLPPTEHVGQTIHVVVGTMGLPLLGTACAAATLPTVLVDQHLTFPLTDFLAALGNVDAGSGGKKGKGEGKVDNRFGVVAHDLFARLTRRSDNRGVSDEHRAANYLALRYPQLYQLAAEAYADEKTLTDVQLRRGSGELRHIVAVRLIFRARRTDMIERYQCLVDVTDRFPFLSSPLTPVYD